MTSPDRQTVPETLPEAAPVPTALRRDGTAPRSLAERLKMLLTLTVIILAVAIPTLVVTGLFGQRPRPKTPVVVQPTPEPGASLRRSLEHSADNLLPTPAALTPDPIPLPVRAGHVAARAEKVARQAAQFGGVATEGVATGEEKHLFVDLPLAASAAFRQAVVANAPLADAASPAPSPAASPTLATGGQDHVEIIIRPTGDDE